MISTTTLRICTGVAVLAALLGTIADTFLLYNPQGGYFAGDYQFLLAKSQTDILIGHYLGIFAIPFEAAGLVLIFQGMLPLGRQMAWASVVLGLMVFMPGVTYHASVFPIWQAIQTGNAGDLAIFKSFSEPLAVVFVAAFFLLMVGFVVAVLSGKTAFPRWVVFLSPPVVYGLLFLMVFALPSVGNFLLPMGFNLCMGIFFLALWMGLVGKGKVKKQEG